MVHIKRAIDLTGENNCHVDFQEAQIIEFNFLEKSLGTVEFELWGARLLVEDAWDHDKSFLPGVPHTDDYYVSGRGRVTVENATGMEVIFSPYSKEYGSRDFCYDTAGKIIEEQRKIGKTAEWVDSYIWECPVVSPSGFASIFIWADGPVTYEFDDKDMIFEKEFFRDPKKYCFQRQNP